MKPEDQRADLAVETAEGLIRLFGSNAVLQADLIAARMSTLKDERGAMIWSEVAEVVRRMQP